MINSILVDSFAREKLMMMKKKIASVLIKFEK